LEGGILRYERWHVTTSATALAVSAVRLSSSTINTVVLAQLSSTGAAKGDLIVFNGTIWVKFTGGTNGQAVVKDSTAELGVKWGTVAGGAGAVESVFARTGAVVADAADYAAHYAALAHVHLIADVTGLQGALDGKSATTHDHAAVYAALSHSHAASAITSEALAAARGGLGADASTFAGVIKMAAGAASAVTGNASDCVHVDGSSAACGGSGTGQITATFLLCAGPCTVDETSNWKWTAPFAATLTSCTIDAMTYPTGAAVTVDVLQQGTTTIFSSTVPTLAAGGTTFNTQTGMSAAAVLTTGQYLIAKVLTAGSTVPGQFVNVACKATY